MIEGPKAKTSDLSQTYPGEGFFFYWKTSSSLWKVRLSEFAGSTIYIPLNWAFHSDGMKDFDFGHFKPESDLHKLSILGMEMGKELIFVIPITPMPFLANGGLPPLLARTLSLDDKGLAMSFVDSERRINKLYSYFDPRVFQAFQKFVWQAAEYFKKNNINNDIMSLEGGYLRHGAFHSYLKDYSRSFDQGFTKFLEIKKSDAEDLFDDENPALMNQLKDEYFNVIDDLYKNTCKEAFVSHWAGEFRANFLGGDPKHIFSRSSKTIETSKHYFEELEQSIVYDLPPTSILLPNEIKRGPLEKALDQSVSKIFAKRNNNLDDEDYKLHFSPLRLFKVYKDSGSPLSELNYYQNGLIGFVDQDLKCTYSISQIDELRKRDHNLDVRNVFLSGSQIDDIIYRRILKEFLDGGRFFIDTDGLAEELNRKFEGFYLENNLKVEVVNYIGKITTVSLGGGKLFFFEGSKLKQSSFNKQLSFWENMLKELDLEHVTLSYDTDVSFTWQRRLPSLNEMSYEEIRRVSLYNPTSYKKKAQVVPKRNLAFLKFVDEIKSEVEATSMGINIQLLPGGAVSLDFGYFEN